MALIPFVLVGLIFLFFFSLSFFYPKHKRTHVFRNSICTITVLMFLMYPTIMIQAFNSFSCYEINDKYYLVQDINIECYTQEHYMILIKYVMPIMVVWVLGFPLMILYLLFKHRDKLDDKDTIIKYGIYYIGLTNKMFYWEIVIVNIRKALFIIIIISLQRANTMYQAVIAIGILYLLLFLLRYMKPYNSEMLYSIDIAATQASILSILLGIFFIDPQMEGRQTAFEIVFLAFILVNAYFIMYWGIEMSKIIVRKVQAIYRKIKKGGLSSQSSTSIRVAGNDNSNQNAHSGVSMTSINREEGMEEENKEGNLTQIEAPVSDIASARKEFHDFKKTKSRAYHQSESSSLDQPLKSTSRRLLDQQRSEDRPESSNMEERVSMNDFVRVKEREGILRRSVEKSSFNKI